MGKKDISTKDYTKRPEVCADIFNQYLYHGKTVIRAEDLRELDTTMLAIPFDTDGNRKPVQRFRDTLKLATMMTDGGTIYCVIGVENQADVHYAMPVRNGLYDFLQLSDQVQKTAAQHKKQRKNAKVVGQKLSGEEFLSGFWKTDQLIPVITVVVYWNGGKWDGACSLREMYQTSDETILKYAPDYHVNLIEPYSMTDQEIKEFQTDMREVMQFIKYSRDKNALIKAIQGNERFRKLDRRVAELINDVTNSKLEIPKEEVEVDMCQAIMDMRIESESIGEARGEARGRARGRAEGIIKTYKDMNGERSGLAKYLMEKCNINREQAEDYIRMYW